MRAIVGALLAAGCSFHVEPANNGTGSGTPDAAPMTQRDAPTTSPACLARETQTFGGHHYFATADSLGWSAAQADCAMSDGHLVKIETSAENDFVTQMFAKSGYTWIGLHDPGGGYVWSDGSALGMYAGWAHPPGPGMCVDSNGTWDGFGCASTNHGGACECE